MYIKALLNIVDSNQGTFFKHFGCESTHFVQTLWMKSNEFIQTSWIRIRSSLFDRFECTARLVLTVWMRKKDCKKKAGANQHICSNMLVVKQSFCSSMLSARKGTCSNILDAKEVICSHFGCEPRHLFKHFGWKAELLQKSWIRSKGICSNVLDAQQALFKQSECEGRHLQSKPLVPSSWIRINAFVQRLWMQKQASCSTFSQTFWVSGFMFWIFWMQSEAFAATFWTRTKDICSWM